MIRQTLNNYRNTKSINQQKVEAGVAVEPDPFVFARTEEIKPEDITLAKNISKEQEVETKD